MYIFDAIPLGYYQDQTVNDDGDDSIDVEMTVQIEELVSLIQQCEDDTRQLLGPLAAQRLGNWRRHADSQSALIEYVQRLLWGEHCANGRKLDNQGGLSLERIVLDRLPGLFSEADREQAKRTLGI